MAEDLLASLGMYGASLVVAFIAGLFPPFSIEVFLVGLVTIVDPTAPELVACCVLAALGHQVAKTITFYAGVASLDRGPLKKKLDKIRPKIDRWNKAPKLVVFLSGLFGLPPLWPIGFIAKPLMGVGIVAFTLIIFSTRIVRFIALAAIVPLLW
jgi:membrane protein YqaA with SNARE-associated domain